jgi:hypothetical protein
MSSTPTCDKQGRLRFGGTYVQPSRRKKGWQKESSDQLFWGQTGTDKKVWRCATGRCDVRFAEKKLVFTVDSPVVDVMGGATADDAIA